MYIVSIFYTTIVYNADCIVYLQVYDVSTPYANNRQYRFNVYVISIFYTTNVYNADCIVDIQVYVVSTHYANNSV